MRKLSGKLRIRTNLTSSRFRNSRGRLETIDPATPRPVHGSATCLWPFAQKDLPMLGFLFGFNARLGRMDYFLSTIALAVVMTAVCFVIVMHVSQHGPRVHSPADLMIWPTMLAAAA